MTWQTKKLGEICEITTGSSNTIDAVENGQYAFFDRSKIIKKSNHFLFDSEALIIPGEGAEFFPRYFKGKFNLHQRAYALLNFHKDIDVKFVEYYLILEHKYFERVAVGATAKSLRRRHFVDLKIPLPPLPEQRRIVKILDEVFAVAEKAKEHAEKNLENARKIFENYLFEIFNNPPLSWKIDPLEEICRLFNGSTPSRSKKEYWEQGNIPWFTVNDIRNYGRMVFKTEQKITKKAVDETSVKLVPENTVLLCCTASVGEYALTKIPLTFNQQFNGLVIKDQNKLIPEFLYFFSATLKRQLMGLSGKATVDFIPLSRLKGVKVPYADTLSEQKVVVNTLEKLSSETKKLEEIYLQKRTLLEELKKSVLHKAFAGEL